MSLRYIRRITTLGKPWKFTRSPTRILTKPIGLAQTADELGYSRATVARLFEEEFGHSVGQEILRQRMDIAKRLLKNDSLTIAEIAYRTGFCNPAYLTNTFHRETGLTPKAWRKKQVS